MVRKHIAPMIDVNADLTVTAFARQVGAYYTQDEIAHYMVGRTIDDRVKQVLEPSFGDGAFLRAAQSAACPGTQVFGIEIREAAYANAIKRQLIPPELAIRGDFLATPPFPVDVVVGNPPYVRLRNLPAKDAKRALRVSRRALGCDMDTSGSVWMPFVLHALNFLRPGGRLALVLPHEVTHVKYARPLWEVLARSFESLNVVRVRERLFPDILQEVVLFFASGFGGSCSQVRLDVYENAADLRVSGPTITCDIPIPGIVAGEREFTRALLPAQVRQLLDGPIHESTVPVRERCTFNIGYVAGDKTFFHPSPEVAMTRQLPAKALRPAATSARSLRGAGLRTSAMPQSRIRRLFFPNPQRLSEPEERYIEEGKRQGIHNRYKCRVRDPWFVVPGVSAPDLLLSVFSSEPLLMLNDARLVASNSLLSGRLRGGDVAEFAASWYTSITRLYLELQVHSLGGGVMVLIPGEVGRVRMPRPSAGPTDVGRIDEQLSAGATAHAYEAGDALLPGGAAGLSKQEMNLVRDAIETLVRWRSGNRISTNGSG